MLSIILPSYKGYSFLKKHLPEFINYASKKNISYEIIIVDDGSEDNGETEKIAKEYGCVFLQNKKNRGKGAAVRKGMLHAKGEYRIFTDADIPFELDAFDRFLYYLEFKEFDIVIGDRTIDGAVYFSEISRIRKISSVFFSFLVGRFITTGMFDTQCGIKGFKAKVAEDLFSVSKINGFAFDVELLYVALKRNYDIKRLPVRLRCNESSSINVISDGMRMLVDLFSIKWNHLRGKYNRKI